jgi:hypothetical protein
VVAGLVLSKEEAMLEVERARGASGAAVAAAQLEM